MPYFHCNALEAGHNTNSIANPSIQSFADLRSNSTLLSLHISGYSLAFVEAGITVDMANGPWEPIEDINTYVVTN
jgi:hypothetical protein